MSELGDNIRRIAGVKELKRKIDELQDLIKQEGDKGNIPSSSFTAYSSQEGGEGMGGESDDRSDSATDSAAGEGAGGAEASNGYTGDMKSLYDNEPALGAKLQSLGGFFDCTTGEEAKINLNGHFDPETIPGILNDGAWTGEATTDPRESQFREGVWYSYAGGYESTNPTSTAQAVAAAADISDPGSAPHSVSSVEAYDVDEVIAGSTVIVNMTRASGDYFINVNGYGTGCTVGVDAWCPAADNRPAYQWSSDDIHNIAFDGAQFLTSAQEADDDVHNKWGDNPSNMSGCDSDGNAVVLTPDLTGGVNIDYGDGKHIQVNSSNIIVDVSGY